MSKKTKKTTKAKKPAPKAPAPKVQVRLVKHCTLGNPGDLVEVDAETAKNMTRIRHLDCGMGQLEEYRVAVPADYVSPEIPDDELMSDEAAALGKKNIVPTPQHLIDATTAPSQDSDEEEEGEEGEESDSEEDSDDQGEEDSDEDDSALVDSTPQE